jgi:Protein of unknown function (DUF742)
MAERGGEDLPDHGAGDASDRLDVDGFRARLFGGPGASLYGDSGIPTQSTWDSKEIPVVGAGNSGVAPAGTGGFWGSSVDMFSEHTGGYVSPPEQEDSSLVRPYFKTGGRTRPDYDLAIEALVSTSDRGRTPDDSVRPVHRAVCGLCLDTRSVAEIAVHQRLPLGAAKVLIADMAGMGLLLIHQSGVVGSDQPSFEFMERVLSGLRRL